MLTQMPGMKVLEAEQLQRSVVTLVRWKHLEISLICSHLPYCSQGLPALVDALQELQPLLEAHRLRGAHVVWGLDANVCLGAAFSCDQGPSGLHEPLAPGKTQQGRAEVLLTFLLDNQMQVATFGEQPALPTWFPGGRGQDNPGRQIDYICSALPLGASWVWDIVAAKSSDHLPLHSHVYFPASRSQKQQQCKVRCHHLGPSRLPLDWCPSDLSAFRGDVAAASLSQDMPLEELVRVAGALASKHASPSASSQLSLVRHS